MAVTIARTGFGYVEPNHLSAPRNGQVYAQLPAAEDITVLENGRFVKYDYAAGECNFDGEGPWMMVFNEEKLYDERHQMHRDYAMQKTDFYDGVMTPRVFALVPGDIYTTNMVKEAEYNVGDELKVGAEGILEAGSAAEGEHKFKVVKETTMPDLQPAVKIQVIA